MNDSTPTDTDTELKPMTLHDLFLRVSHLVAQVGGPTAADQVEVVDGCDGWPLTEVTDMAVHSNPGGTLRYVEAKFELDPDTDEPDQSVNDGSSDGEKR
jgi:hypothetical protein